MKFHSCGISQTDSRSLISNVQHKKQVNTGEAQVMMHNTWSKGVELRLKYEDVQLGNEGTEVIDHDSYRLDHKLGDFSNKSGTWVVITQKMKTVMRKGTHRIILIYLSNFTTKSTWNFDPSKLEAVFEKSFSRHQYDPKNPDFTWKCDLYQHKSK